MVVLSEQKKKKILYLQSRPVHYSFHLLTQVYNLPIGQTKVWLENECHKVTFDFQLINAFNSISLTWTWWREIYRFLHKIVRIYFFQIKNKQTNSPFCHFDPICCTSCMNYQILQGNSSPDRKSTVNFCFQKWQSKVQN